MMPRAWSIGIAIAMLTPFLATGQSAWRPLGVRHRLVGQVTTCQPGLLGRCRCASTHIDVTLTPEVRPDAMPDVVDRLARDPRTAEAIDAALDLLAGHLRQQADRLEARKRPPARTGASTER